MKKLFFYLIAVFCALTTSAQGWVVPTNQSYDKEHVVYAGIDGVTANDGYVVGAFIDGECRGYISASVSQGATTEVVYFPLRVQGGSNDSGKNITFKVYDSQFGNTYTLTQTLAYIPDGTTGEPSNLYKLNFVKATSYSFQNTSVDIYVGSAYDIEYAATPAGGQLPDGFDDAFVVNQVASVVSIDGKTLTGLQIGTASVYNTMLRSANGELTVNVVDRPIPVESITINQDLATTIYVYDDLDLNPYFTVNPSNATNKSVTVTADNNNVTITESDGAAGEYTLVANSKGTTVVTIASVENPTIKAQITFTIKQHVDFISMNQAANYSLKVGQMINLADYYVIGPDDADNKEVNVTTDSDIFNISGAGENWSLVAQRTGNGVVTITSIDNPEAQVALYFDVIQLAERITVTPNTFDIVVGEAIDCGSQMQVVIYPQGVDQTYSLSTVDTDIVEVQDAAVAAARIVGLKKGTATVTISTVDGSRVSTTITVNVHNAIEGFKTSVNEVTMSSTEVKNITITPSPADALLKDELEVSIVAPSSPSQSWKYVDGTLTKNGDGSYNLELNAYSMGEGAINLTYGSDGLINIPSIPLHVGFEYELVEGWNWVSVFSDGVSTATQTMNGILGNKLIEARTQDGLLYNDPVYGYFGDFTDFGTDDKCYKLKVNVGCNYMLFGSYNSAANVSLRTGWNWLPYTCEYDQIISLAGTEGDVILSLADGMAVYSQGGWMPSNFTLKAGQGYLYYTDKAREIGLPDPYNCEQTVNNNGNNAPAFNRSHWTYNPHLYSSIMPIIAVIDGYDTDNYTVGAFVGGDCRGEGRLVDGKWFITVAGEHSEYGEEVSFQIYDKATCETVEVTTTVEMSSILGTVNDPVCLSAEGTTPGLSSVREIEAGSAGSSECYDLFGRRVANPGRGIYIVNGRKVIVK